MNVLELGSYLVPAYAGMFLAEQGHTVEKWTQGEDPIQRLRKGDELWRWVNVGKAVHERHAREVGLLGHGDVDGIVDNIRAATWERWGIDPAKEARRLRVPWVSMRDEFNGRSFDAVAQARAWGDHLGWLPVALGDTAGGLFLAFKLLSMVNRGQDGHHVLRQATCLAKLVEGNLGVLVERDGKTSPWESSETYGATGAGVRVVYRDETTEEPFRDDAWRLENLRHYASRLAV